MSRFYFHTDDGGPLRDREGVDLLDLDAARFEAVRAVGEMLKERAGEFWSDGVLRMSVSDPDGLILFLIEVSVTEAPAIGSALARPPRSR